MTAKQKEVKARKDHALEMFRHYLPVGSTLFYRLLCWKSNYLGGRGEYGLFVIRDGEIIEVTGYFCVLFGRKRAKDSAGVIGNIDDGLYWIGEKLHGDKGSIKTYKI